MKIENACNGFRAERRAPEARIAEHTGSFQDINHAVLREGVLLDAADLAVNGNRGCFVLLAEGKVCERTYWPEVKRLKVPVHAFIGEAHRAILRYFEDTVGDSATGLKEGDVRALLPGRCGAQHAVIAIDDSSAASIVFGHKRFLGKQEETARRSVTASNLARVFDLGTLASRAPYISWEKSMLRTAVCCHYFQTSTRAPLMCPPARRSLTRGHMIAYSAGCFQRIV